MCQIQFIKTIGRNLNKTDLQQFFKLMTFGSLHNGHAFGFFNRNHMFKKTGIFNLKSFEADKLLQDNFIVGHNRFTTQGSENKNKNNHPFELNGFLLVHNGVLNEDEAVRKKFKIKSDIETDSYVILWLINHFYHLSKKEKPQKKMVEAIKKTCAEIEGYYSVFVFDKNTKDLYYFKSERADFKFCLIDDNIVLGTTDYNNLDYVYTNKKYIFDEDMYTKKSYKTPKAETIYLINDGVVIKEIGKFKERLESFYEDYKRYGKGDFEYQDLIKEIEDEEPKDIKDLRKTYDLIEEIDATFEGVFGFVPDYRLVKNNSKIKIKSSEIQEDVKALTYFIEGVTTKKGNIFIDVDEFLNANYLTK